MSTKHEEQAPFRSYTGNVFASTISHNSPAKWFQKTKYPVSAALRIPNVTYRIINTWGEKGLLGESQEKNKWRFFTTTDLLWIAIVTELRRYGLSLDLIRCGKNKLDYYLGNTDSPWDPLGWAISNINMGFPMSLLVYADGWMEVGFGGICKYLPKDGIDTLMAFNMAQATQDNPDLEDVKKLFTESWKRRAQHLIPDASRVDALPSVLEINLNQLCSTALRRSIPHYEKPPIHVPKEAQQVIDMIRDEKFEEINIIKRDNKMHRIKVTGRCKSPETADELWSLVRSLQYGETKLLHQDGKILVCTQIETKKDL